MLGRIIFQIKSHHLWRLHTCAIRKADRKPDWICPKCTTPVTPTTSSMPSQWFGFENWSSFSGPHGFAPLPQLNTNTNRQTQTFSVIHSNYMFSFKFFSFSFKTNLKILRMIIPSTGGKSTTLPSTSKRSSLCNSLTIFRPTILRRPIFT